MNNRQNRTVMLLSAILLVLVVLVCIVAGVKHHRAVKKAESAVQTQTGALAAQNAYTALSYSNGTTTLSFALDEESDTWHWSDDPDFPLNDSTVRAITELLQSLTPQQTLTDGQPAETYGLDDPFATLTATGEDGSTLTLALGNATSDGKSYYLLKNGDESTVYIIADTLYQKLCVPIYDMMKLPETPALTETMLRSVKIQGAAETTLTAIHPKDGGMIWRSGGVDVTENEQTTAVIQALGTLSLTRCVDFKPSAAAAELCGFGDAPTAVFTVIYGEDDASDKDYTLTVGAQALGGAGYYVRQGSDSTIYEMPIETLAPLLAVASGGLEG